MKRAKTIANQFLQGYKENIENTKTLLKSYTALLVNYQNVHDYFNTLNKENAYLKKKLQNMNADILTNDRKSYYEDQGIDTLNFYYSIFFYIYILILIVFLLCMIFKSSDFSKGKQIIIFIFLNWYIIIAVPIFRFILGLYKKMVDLLPKNVHIN
jgi:hypothetical protein